jgi:alkyl hydroperoxide reductase subunit F
MFDVLIVGGGPAALAAAVYIARQKLSFIMVAPQIGGQVSWSSDVENYLGFHLLDGVELVKRFRTHLEDYQSNFTLKEGETVSKLEKIPQGFRALTTNDQVYEAKTVLIATGSQHRALDVPGEKKLYGRGVTYCATCDGPLFRDKVVFVIGGGNSAMDAALLLEKYAERVTIITVNNELKGDEIMHKKINASSKIKVKVQTKVQEVLGETKVTGIKLVAPDGSERVEVADGVLIEIGLVPASQMVDFVAKDKRGQIVISKTNATNVEGVWAAGDVTDVTQKQIAVAVGEGAKAALSIIQYLQTTE